MRLRSPILSAIVAMDEHRVIGQNNQLPWRLPTDLRHFKALTMGHPIVMGRKTYESIGKPLSGRMNIVMTRDASFQAAGCEVVTSIDAAIVLASAAGNDEIFIIGGAQIYQQLLPCIQRLYLTIVHHAFVGDAYFPELNWHEWIEMAREKHAVDEQNAYAYSFVQLERR